MTYGTVQWVPFSNYLKKANAIFPPARSQGLSSWGHIPQTPCQRGLSLWTPRGGILRLGS